MRRDLDERPGWVFTFTGEPFWPLEPRKQDVRILDIAHHLSQLCRYGGATRRPYSVAQHSVIVSQACPQKFALHGLLHDGSEAYLVDITVPVKGDRALAGYRAIEERVQRVIYERFGLSPEEPEEVKRVDRVVALTEIRDLVNTPDGWHSDEVQPLKKRVLPLGADRARSLFLNRFCVLTGTTMDAVLAEGRR